MRSSLLTFILCLLVQLINAQTNPSPQNLPYSFTAMTSTIPTGMAIHRFGTSAGSIPVTRTTTPGNGDLPFGAANNQGGWHNHGADGVGLLASGSNAAGAIIVAINTVGKTNISVSWLCRTTFQQASRDNSIALQYRVGTSGNFIDVGTTSTYSSTGQPTGASSSLFTETLPVGAENQSVVQVRWIYWESVSTSGSRDKIAVDEISINGNNSNVTADRLTISGIPTSATVNTPFTISVCATNEAGQTQSSYSTSIALAQIFGTTATVSPSSPQTPVNGCSSWTITPLVANEDINFEGTSGTLIPDQTGPIPVFAAPEVCFDDNCNFEAVAVSLNENSTNWFCNAGAYNINAFCTSCPTPTNTWLISPDFSILSPTPQTFLAFTLDQNFTGPALQVSYTLNFTGNPATTTWISLGTAGPDGNYNFDLSSISGSTIQFGIQYTANGQANGTAQYNVSNIRINSVNCGNLYENNCAINEIDVEYLNNCDNKNTTDTKDDSRTGNIVLNNIIQGQTTGTIDLLINNILLASLPATGATSYTFSNIELPANNEQNVLKARFSVDTNCFETIILDAQASCSVPVALALSPGFNDSYYMGTVANVNVCYVDENGNLSPQNPFSTITLTDDPDLTSIISTSTLPDNACQNFVISMDVTGEVIFTASENTFGLTKSDTTDINPNPCVFISELVDPTSGNNKYVEIFNGGSQVADLTGYKLNIYRNGSTVIGSSFNVPNGITLQPGQTFVFRNSAAGQDFSDCGILQITSSSLDANGNDAYELAEGTYVHDRYGVVGEDPAVNTSWNYVDKIVTRNFDIQCGNNIFDLEEWNFAPYTSEETGTPCYHCVEFNGSIVTQDTTLCSGNDLTLTATGGSTYEWTGPNGYTGSGATQDLTDIQSAQGGLYIVSISNGEFCLPILDTVVVTVSEPDILTASLSPDQVCIGATVSMQAEGGQSYQWTGPDNFSSDLQAPQLLISSVSQAGTYTVISTNNCLLQDSLEFTLVVNEELEIEATSSATQICSGGSVSFNVTNGQSYQWTGPAGFTAATQNPVINNFTAANAGEYIVVVTASDPCNEEGTVTLSDTITISVNVSPEIIATVIPNPVCTGGTVILNTTVGASYSWTGPNNFTSAIQSPQISNIQVNQSGQYFITVTSAEGCISTNSVNLTVNQVATGTAIATPNPVCVGSTLQLSAQGGTFYSWSGPDGFTSDLQNPVRNITALTQAGTYNVSITSSEGCNSTASVSVEVNPELTGSIGVTPSVACVGNTVQLFASGGNTYVWTGPNGYISSQQNPVIIDFQYAQRGTYTVEISNNNGCNAILAVEVEAYFPPISSATYDLSTACVGSDLKLFGEGAGGFNWTGPAGFISNLQDVIIPDVSAINSGIYRLVVTSPNGCKDTSTINVLINTPPVLTLDSDTIKVCEGSTVSLTASGSGSFNWTGPWGWVSEYQNPVIENIPGYMSGIFTTSLTGSTGCVSSDSVVIEVSYYIKAEAWASTDTVCEGSVFQLFASGGTKYVWTGPAGFYSTDQNPRIDGMTKNKAGTYGVLITNEGGCQDFLLVQVWMKAGSVPAWAVATPNPVNEGQPVQFTSSDGISHIWNGPASFSSNEQNPLIKRVSRYNSGVYTLEVENENGCPSFAKVNLRVNSKNNGSSLVNNEEGVIEDNTVEIEKEMIEGNVFPNPTANNLYFDNQTQGSVKYTIMNAAGQIIVKDQTTNDRYIITVNLQSGVYYILWKGSEEAQMKWNKFVKIR